jgi:hypothetical protein
MAVPEINIFQWNSRNFKANQNALSKYTHDNPSFSILSISETHLHPAETLQFENFVVYRADRQHQKGGGAALFIHPDLPADQIHFHSQLEAVAVQVMCNGRKTTVLSIYLPPNQNLNKEFDDLISQIPQPAIICGDLNALIQNQGSAYSNQRGRFIQRLAAAKNFTILNSNQPTLLQRPNTNPTAPDLTLVSDHFIDYFDWQVADVTLGSDHYPITLTAPVTQLHHRTVSPPRRRKFVSAKWELYTSILQHKSPPLPHQNIEDWYLAFTAQIQDAADKSIPWTKPSNGNPRRQPKAWWTADCETAYKEMVSAQRNFRKHPESLAHYIKSNMQAHCRI